MQWWQLNTSSVSTWKLIRRGSVGLGAKQKPVSTLCLALRLWASYLHFPSIYESWAPLPRSLFWSWSIFSYLQQLRGLSQNWSKLLVLELFSSEESCLSQGYSLPQSQSTHRKENQSVWQAPLGPETDVFLTRDTNTTLTQDGTHVHDTGWGPEHQSAG